MSADVRANRSSVFAHGTYDTGGGADDHLPIAESWSGLALRGVIDFPKVDWTGQTELVSAVLHMTSTDQVHVARGSSPGAEVRRATEQWSPNTATDDGSGNWTTSPDTYPGPSSTSTDAVNITGRDGNELTDSWDVTKLVLAWAPTTVKGPGGAYGKGAKQYGLVLLPRDGSSRIAEWYSAKAGTTSKRPRLVVTTKAAPVPAKPSLVAPLGPMADGRTYRFTTDMAPTKWDVDVDIASGFPAPIWAPRNQTTGISGTAVAATYAGPVYTPGTTYYWRARVANANGTSAWSATGTFTADPNPTGRDPWEEWASAILDQQSDPRLVMRPGVVRPEGSQVAALVTADMGARVRVDLTDRDSPFRSEGVLIGAKVEVDANGWTVTPVLGGQSGTADDWTKRGG